MKGFFRARPTAAVLGLVLAASLAACGGSDGMGTRAGAVGDTTTTPGGGTGTGTTPGGTTPDGSGASGTLKVLSNRADLISGGDALVELVLPTGAAPADVAMTLNGKDVTSQFGPRANGRYMGQLTGLALGANTLSSRIGAAAPTTVTIDNHPNGGPVFAGPQPQPWKCSNAATALDKQCNQPAAYTLLYKSTDPSKVGLQPYDPASPPTDVATTTTQGGQTMPFIVRRETGFQDRDQYLILALFDPKKDWTPWTPQAQWNHKLLITHGGSCGITFQDGTPPLDDYSGTIPSNPAIQQSYVTALGQGFVVASTALDNLGHNCNITTQAESLVMVKERVVEQYGELRYTLGTGCSGGSITQHHVANAYPGVFQGLIVACSYPDVFTTAVQFADANLLRTYFENPMNWGAGVAWTPEQFAQVEGYLNHANAVVADEAFFKRVTNPANTACPGVANGTGPDKVYDPTNNPGGVRCGVLDYMINVFGPRDPSVWSANEKALGRGFGGFPADTVGIQYGLGALQQGVITAAQFVDLNQRIGGDTIDFLHSADRITADPQALANAYRSGAINVGTNLDKVPIIDGRGPDPGAAHDSVHVFMLRARLDQLFGTHANQVIWEGPVAILGDVQYANNALVAMDRWVTAIEADKSAKTLAQKVIADKPADVADACYDGNGTKVSDGLCPDAVVPVYSTPRLVAGDALTAVTNKCQLKPLNKSDNYGLLGLTDAQFAALKVVFPTGVCDFTKPPVSYGPTVAWLTYQDAVGSVVYGGAPLPAAAGYSGAGWASPGFKVFAAKP